MKNLPLRVAQRFLKKAADFDRALDVAKTMFVGGVAQKLGPEESQKRLQRSYGLSPDEAVRLY